jgi:hypothetical protein
MSNAPKMCLSVKTQNIANNSGGPRETTGALNCADIPINSSATAQMASGTPNTKFCDRNDFGSATLM